MEYNITYLFGAGASYYACPILNEQGDKMIEISEITGIKSDSTNKEYKELTRDKKAILNISNIGYKANEFNTIDTYAKRLYLLGYEDELKKLKDAVNLFFTLWHLTDNNGWKNLDSYLIRNSTRKDKIDHRFINLLATYLVKGVKYPILRSNIKFITWNYDLQIESAYNKFTDFSENSFIEVNKYLPFIPEEGRKDNLVVCHLNGFHGFYGKDFKNSLFEERFYSDKGIFSLLNNIYSLNNFKENDSNLNQCINYAWEKDSILANCARENAKRILSKTDILVIIGYSFPPFNNEIDKEILNVAKERVKRVIYQDPLANKEIIYENFGIPKSKVVIVNENMNQFIIPNYSKEDRISKNLEGYFR